MSEKIHKRTSAILLPVLVLMMVSIGGCDWIGSLGNDINFFQREFSNTEDILNRAVADIDANSQNWQRIMQQAIDQVNPSERQIRQDLEDLMQRGIHTVGLEARCDLSYLADMLVGGLQRIQAKVLHKDPPPLKVVVCDASPSFVDMNLGPNQRNNIEIYGYNLDMSWLKLYHVMESSQKNESAKFSSISPFKRVINLGSNGIVLAPNSVKLRMDLGGGENRDIPVIQKWPEVCTTRTWDTNSASIQVIPRHVGRGDKEFNGHGPCIRATAQVFSAENGTQLYGSVDVDMWECPDNMTLIRKDYTEGIGREERVIFTPDQDEEIVEILSPMAVLLEFVGEGINPQSKTDSGLVSRWNIVGDTEGNDVGESYVTATFNPVRLVLRKKSNCVTENELARMMQQNSMSDAMRNHLRSAKPRVLEIAGAIQSVVRKRVR